LEETILTRTALNMTEPQHREIVIEFERVQMIRKRARTELRHCERCGAMSDSVSHVDAAELFEISPSCLFQYVKQHDCHYHVSYIGKTYLCVASLLEHMHERNNIRLSLAKGE
jgi:hypothetical protein